MMENIDPDDNIFNEIYNKKYNQFLFRLLQR